MRPKPWPLPMLALAALSVLAAAGPVRGQTEAATPRPDPLDARAPVPPVAHVSPLAAYRRADEPSVGSWREANDTVTRIGGWRTYTREANQPEAPAAAATGGAAGAPAARPAAAEMPPAPPAPGHHGRHDPK